jgi:16S rRNA processing protein RimM
VTLGGSPTAPPASGGPEPDQIRPLRVSRARWHHGRLIVTFDGVTSREDAEQLRGSHLLIDEAESGEAGDDAWWDHQLEGLAVRLPDGSPLGRVREVRHTGGQDLLVVERPGSSEVLVPLVRAMVPVVDPGAGHIVVDPPEGLLDL